MDKIRLKGVKITGLDGKVMTVDVSKDVADAVYFKTQSLEVAEAMRELYHSGECGYSDNIRDAVKEAVSRMFGVVVRTAIEEQMTSE